ncbi:MAG: hypothetical protein R6V40_00585 [Candidatus Moraniibacteriota bacterium]
MKRKILGITVVFAAAVLLSGCGEEDQKDAAPGNNQSQQKSMENDSSEKSLEKKAGENTEKEGQAIEDNFKGSVLDLLSKEKNLKCQWSFSEESEQSGDGVIYISGNKYRQDINLTQPSKMQVYAIGDQDWIYSWNSQSETGLKMKKSQAKETSQEDNEGQTNENKTMDISKDFNFNCSEWDVNESKFQLPDEINFIDYSQQMKQLESGIQNSNPEEVQQDPCSLCESLSGAAKEKCLESCQ